MSVLKILEIQVKLRESQFLMKYIWPYTVFRNCLSLSQVSVSYALLDLKKDNLLH